MAVRLLMRLGWVRLASQMLSLSLWLIFSLVALQQGGINAPVIRNYIIVILIAGLLSGWRSAIGFSGLCLLSVLLMHMAQVLGLLPSPMPLVPSAVLMSLVITITLAGILVSLATRGTDDALRKSQESLLVAQEVAHLGSFERDFRTGEGRWSNEIYRMLGVSPEECEPTYENFLKYVHPDDVKYLEDAATEGVSKASTQGFDYRIIRPSGEVRTLYTQGETFADESGTPIRLVGTLLDITERKAIEEALRESEKTTKALVNAHTGVSILLDPDSEPCSFPAILNSSKRRASGLAREYLFSKSPSELLT
ncbi:MAG: PAS domain-containing protein [Acidobacteria bacterium]|nr:PAS domain-containing protein [Acidobacteriota bacterium]